MHLHATLVNIFYRFNVTFVIYAPQIQFFLELLDRSKLLKCFWLPVHKRAYRNWCTNIFKGQFADVVDESGGDSDNVLPTVSVCIHEIFLQAIVDYLVSLICTIDSFTGELYCS
jgi:hypothetical protein